MPSVEPSDFVTLWEMWRDYQHKIVPYCTIITTAGTDLLRPEHKRTPLVLRRDMELSWLDRSNNDPTALLSLPTPSHDDEMEVYEASILVNTVATSYLNSLMRKVAISAVLSVDRQYSLPSLEYGEVLGRGMLVSRE